ncbi:MAG: hypothetical protein ABIS14_06570 [Sphingomonas sp.]
MDDNNTVEPAVTIDQDRSDIDALIAAFYAAFDNRTAPPVGDRLRGMFATGARVTRKSASGLDTWDVEAFIAPRIAMLSDGSLTDFHEWETEASTELAGSIASRFSEYSKAGMASGTPVRGSGRKFIQLVKAADRWRIVSVLWEDLA